MKSRLRLTGLIAVGILVMVAGVVTVVNRSSSRTVTQPEFVPLSFTFFSGTEGFVLGTITPCDDESGCLRIQRTTDSGRTWIPDTAINPPEKTSALRFANRRDGWADTGRELWSTHDGGVSWGRTGMVGSAPDRGTSRGSEIIVADDRIQVVRSSRDGDRLELFTSRADSDTWALTAAIDTGIRGFAANSTIETVSSGDTTWVTTRGRTDDTPRISAKIVGDQWLSWQPPCQGELATLRASSPTDVVALCDDVDRTATGARARRVLMSNDGGVSFTEGQRTPPAILSAILGTTPLGVIVLAADGDIHTSFDGGREWTRTFSLTGRGARFLGQGSISGDNSPQFVSPTDAFTLETRRTPSDDIHRSETFQTLLATHDGGRTWATVEFTPDTRRK